jgi:hypothetical protein
MHLHRQKLSEAHKLQALQNADRIAKCQMNGGARGGIRTFPSCEVVASLQNGSLL